MKNKLYLLFTLLCVSVMGWAATQYCGETSPNSNFTFTLKNVSGNTYRIQFDAIGADKFVSAYNINCGVNQSAGAGIFFGGDNATNWVFTDDQAYLDFTTASAGSVPTGFYGNYFCFNKKGGGLIEISNFNPADVDWTAACSAGDATPPTMISATKASQTYNTVVINVAADDNVGVTKYVIKNHSDDSEVGEYTPAAGQITVEGLTPETAYDWDVYAKDAAGNVSVAGINVTFTTDAAPSNIYCVYEIGHEGNPSADLNSFILLSVGSDGNGHTIVNVKQDDAKNSAMFDYINIVGKKDIGADVATGGSDEMAIVFPTPTPDGDGNIALDIQWSTINWGGRWQCHVELPADATCATADPFPGDNTYCSYTDNQLRANNANVALTWGTDGSGNVIVDISDGEGATNTAFRNGGFENEGSFAATWFVYSGTNHTTCEPATTYFNNGGTLSNENKRFTLTKKANLPANAVIAFFGHAFSWRTDQATGAYTLNKYFAYQYGYNCPMLTAPTNVAVDGSKVITFDAVANAETYTAKVYLDGILKHQQVVASGDVLSFTPYTTGTYQVQVVADAAGYPTSEPSTAYDWALTAPAIVVGNSEYCEYAIGSGTSAAALTWETSVDGSITITIQEVLGGAADATHFRGTGMNISNFQVGEAKTSASAYFNHACGGSNQVTLTLKNASVKPGLGEKIYYTDKVVEWATSGNNNAYSNLTFEYTYGTVCSGQKHVTVAVNNNEWGSATVNGGASADVDAGTTVTCVATPATGYEFVNWTKGGVEVATTATYTPTIDAATDLVANFDYARTTYCHQAVTTNGGKKLYLTVGKGATEGTYQIKIYGSEELTITGINNANTAVNHIKYLTYDGNDVPLTIANGGWSFEAIGYGVISSAEIQPQTNHTWRDIWMWRSDLYIGTSAGEQNINAVLNQQNHFNWNSTCSDATAPVFAKAEGAVLDATSVRLTIQATDNWEGVLTYTIARAGAEPIISNHASGEEFTQDVTGLTTGTEYDFTVTVSDGVNNANTHILVTPVGDETKPVMGTASLESKTWNSAIINVAATDNIGVASFYIVELDQDFVASEGKITVTGLTQGIAYSFTIKAKDGAGNLSENSASVNFTTDAHLTAPATAAPVPTWPAAQVKSLYSDSYSLAPSAIPNYNDCWWDCPNANEGDVEGNNYMLYDLYRNGMIGVSFANISVATMEKIHLDIWASAAGSVTFRPITGGSEIRQTLNLAAQQWNSFDLDMADFTGQDWANLYQYAIENYQAGGLVGEHICVDNVFFYRETALTDAEAPTNLSVDVTQENFSSVKLTVSAEDNSGAVNFSIKNGDTEVASGAAAAGVATIISVKDLTPGTNYVFKVIAKDDADNAIEQDGVAVTTLVLPGAATSPTQNSALVKSLYSDAYTPIVNVENYCEWWWQSPTVHPTTLSANEHVLFYDNLNNGASFGWSWNVGNKIDFTGFQKLHLHIYPSQSGTIEIYPVIAPEAEFHKVSQTLTAGQWNDIVLDYTDKTFAPLNQIGFVNFFNLGEFFIDNVYFYAEVPAKDVVRDGLNAGKWGTICPKQTVENVEGATFYQISYLEEQNGVPFNMVWDEIEGTTLTAGQPYFFIADGTQILGNKTGAELTVAGDGVNGFYGYISSTDATMELTNWHTDYDANEEYNTFIIYNNSVFRINQGGTMLNSERCYININSTEPSRGVVAPAPGLKRLNMSISGTNETTDIDALKVSDKPVKMIIDGQLYILREGKLYDLTGRMVK